MYNAAWPFQVIPEATKPCRLQLCTVLRSLASGHYRTVRANSSYLLRLFQNTWHKITRNQRYLLRTYRSQNNGENFFINPFFNRQITLLELFIDHP